MEGIFQWLLPQLRHNELELARDEVGDRALTIHIGTRIWGKAKTLRLRLAMVA